ncbi:hypothetical protein A3219_20940 [Salmonella enterica]|nr:hypothetical protein A3219_20940 [Salmonella enterica]
MFTPRYGLFEDFVTVFDRQTGIYQLWVSYINNKRPVNTAIFWWFQYCRKESYLTAVNSSFSR